MQTSDLWKSFEMRGREGRRYLPRRCSFTGMLGRAEMATAVAEQQWDWSDGRCSLDSSSSHAGLAVETALQASESVPPSLLSADSLEQESPSPRKGGGSLWLSKGDDFGTEVSLGSAHG